MDATPIVAGVQFRPVIGIAGYMVGDDGSVWSPFTKMKSRKPGWYRVSQYRRPYGCRYCVVCLRDNAGRGKVVTKYVHRLVLESFVGPCPPGQEACHNDGNTANNCVNNLRWDTHLANIADTDRHGRRRHGEQCNSVKLNATKVTQIRLRFAQGECAKKLGREFGVRPDTVRSIACGKSWQHLAMPGVRRRREADE